MKTCCHRQKILSCLFNNYPLAQWIKVYLLKKKKTIKDQNPNKMKL